MKSSELKLSLTDIKNWVDSASFSRGQTYYHQGMIIDPRRQGKKLKAHCLGSSAPSYRIEVTLSNQGITEADCSCPVGIGGHCKHVAALLLTWLNMPEVFEECIDADTSLEQRNKDELIAIIRQMLHRYPDLEYLLDLPSPMTTKNNSTVDPNIIRQQVSRTFTDNEGNWGWQNFYDISRDLDELLHLAGQYQEQSDIRNSAIIYRVGSNRNSST